jgi:hypothetical protein
MLVQYTPISSLTPEQQARLKAQVSTLQLEGVGHIVFEGFAISKADLRAHFTESKPKPPGQLLKG